MSLIVSYRPVAACHSSCGKLQFLHQSLLNDREFGGITKPNNIVFDWAVCREVSGLLLRGGERGEGLIAGAEEVGLAAGRCTGPAKGEG